MGRRLLVTIAVWGAGCGGQVAPAQPSDVVVAEPEVARPLPAAGMPVIPLLHPPFHGTERASNPFDHRPTPQAPSPLEVLDWRGVRVAGTRGHRGWDWSLPIGTPILALADGVVTHAGPIPPFRCNVLGRDVSEQLAVNVQHVTPDGQVIETSMHHLSRVDVAVGDHVHRGEVVGLSGNSGCSLGPHLHLDTYVVLPTAKRLIDPFGWLGGGPDPWAEAPSGAASVWMWAEAPAMWFLSTRAPDAAVTQRPAYLSAVRYQGWLDDLHPTNEYVEIARDPRFGPQGPLPLKGWSVNWPDGHTTALPDDLVLADGVPVRLHAGSGRARPPVIFDGSAHSLLPDGGGMVRLLDPGGMEVDRLVYGLSDIPSQRPPASEVTACTEPGQGCVPIPFPGNVSAPRWSADGRRVAVGVGEDAVPVVVDVDAGWTRQVGSVGAVGVRGASHPAWLGDDLLVFDAPRLPAVRVAWVGVPGLSAGPALPLDFGHDVRVADARDGMLALSRTEGNATLLFVWRVGDETPRPLTSTITPELGTRISPDRTQVIFEREGGLFAVDVATGASSKVARVHAGVALQGWLGGDPVWFDDGQVLRAHDGVTATVLDGVHPVVGYADDGSALVAFGGEGLLVVDASGAIVARVPVSTLPVEVAIAPFGDQWRVAWTAPTPLGAVGLHVATVP